ncbi:MAG: acyl-CoA dehydrogenase, partial [Calditrichia bacterium]|nr:acyl-CoA dehydrogenase [Calditrichia bacterium]
LIKYVMSLMNEARVGVSAQALGIAEAAYREALKYANERVQFKKKIIEFTPVAEMLVNMKVKIETARALLYETNRIVDIKEGLEEHVEHHPEKKQELRQEIKRYEALAAMFTPICKAYATEIGNQVAYDGLQIHGGTGFMKEFNAERHYRDVRITNIYEGTTQLQVVAAIGGVVKGIAQNIIEEYENNFDFTTVDYYHKKVKKMFSNFEKAVQYIKNKADLDYQNYHAQRLVEMATNVIISYLLMREAVKSERKKDILKFFLEFAMPETKMKYEVITDNTDSLLQNKDYILEGKN